MKTSGNRLRRRLFGACAVTALGGLAAATVALPTAAAEPAPCSASEFSATASSVLGSAGQFLEAHPEADKVITEVAAQPAPEASASLRGYFGAHPGEYFQLQTISQPLSDLKRRCNSSISPFQLAALADALS
jgi:heme-binding protein